MKLTTWSVLGIIAFVFGLVWVYQANPGNIFQRGQTSQSTV